MSKEHGLSTLLDEQLKPLYDKYYVDAPKSAQIILEHCGIAGACGLVPIPYADIAILLPSQIVMYGRLNKVLGVSLSHDTLHVIGKFMLSQMAGILASIPLAVAAKIVGGLLKFIPVLGSLCGAMLDGAANAAITYVLGVVYLKALVRTAGNGQCDAEKLKEALDEEFADKENIRDLYRMARESASKMDFKKFKQQAEDYKE